MECFCSSFLAALEAGSLLWEWIFKCCFSLPFSVFVVAVGLSYEKTLMYLFLQIPLSLPCYCELWSNHVAYLEDEDAGIL